VSPIYALSAKETTVSKEDNERVREKHYQGILPVNQTLRERIAKINSVQHVQSWPDLAFQTWLVMHEIMLGQFSNALKLVNAAPDNADPKDWPEKTPEFIEAEQECLRLTEQATQAVEMVKRLRTAPVSNSTVH
jgi:hypothetical protein